MAKRILAFGFTDPLVREVIPCVARHDQVERIYWITDIFGGELNSSPSVRVIDLQEALTVLPQKETATLTNQLFECYKRIEPIVLKMLDRVQKHGPTLDYDKRKLLFHRNFYYWLTFIREHGITAFISQDVPHEITDYIIAEICRSLGISTIAFTQIGTDGVMPLGHYQEIGTEHQSIRSTLTTSEREQMEQTFSRRVERYAAIGRGEPIKLFYTKPEWKQQLVKDTAARRRKRFLGKFRRLLKNPFKKGSWRYAWFLLVEKPLFRERAFRRLQKRYDSIAQSDPDLSVDFIYLGLHYQPEMTTSPLGEVFVDQYLIAHVLLAAFPSHVKVFVKEHPNQLAGGRPADYYDLFPASERIVFIDNSYSSQRLQQHCLAVATIVGTVGFEGLWSGKPALIFGNAYYRRAPGVFEVHSVQEARAAAKVILKETPTISHKALIKFMHWLQGRLLPANLNGYYGGDSPYGKSPKENAGVLVREIFARLEI